MTRDFGARVVRALLLASAIGLLAACGGGANNAPADDPATTLTIIAGSELADMKPILDDVRAKTGVTLALTYSGTLAGVDRINSGEHFDGAWFASAKYLVLSDTSHRIRAQQRIMLSPVVLGVKKSKADALGWSHGAVTWRQIADAAGSGRFTYAMTNPASSNSGFSAVIGVASAFAPSGDALRLKDVDAASLQHFFAGQKLTAGSSGWLADRYVDEQDRLDGLVNYESTLLALDASGKLREPLTLVYPREGIVTADYPFVLLDETKRPLYEKVVAYLTSTEAQRAIVAQTFRRPIDPSVPLPAAFPKNVLVEAAFPRDLATVNGIIERFLNQERTPAHAFFVLDTSGSMEGDRIAGLRAAIDALAGEDASLTGTFARFENRERVTFISFSDVARAPVDFVVHGTNDTTTFGAIKAYADALHADGATAIYDAIETALADAEATRASDGPRYASIVLMTDGENNRGDSFEQFKAKYEALPPDRRVRVFPVEFGEGDPKELRALAALTGGRAFDAKHDSLAVVFKDIRGYQ